MSKNVTPKEVGDRLAFPSKIDPHGFERKGMSYRMWLAGQVASGLDCVPSDFSPIVSVRVNTILQVVADAENSGDGETP